MKQQMNPVFQPYADEPAVVFLLESCVGRLMRREGETFAVDKERLRHIADWLRAAVVNDEPWLKNVDAYGRPKKLLKFGSIDAIAREADKAMIKAAQKLRDVKLVDGDEELVEVLADGYYVVRLLTPAALDRESARMQHCIGNGGYDDSLNDGRHTYLSLRDPQGKAHVTMEIENGKIVQLQGKQNRPPIQRYINLLIPYIRASGMTVDMNAIPVSHLGHVIDVDGEWHAIENLPEGLKVKGSLDLDDTPIAALPDNLTVRGDLYLDRTPITALPKGLTVDRRLFLRRTSIVTLPEDLSVGEGIYLSNSKIAVLPDGLTFSGDLYLDDTPIAALPDNLTVIGDLYLNRTSITALPKGLSVGGILGLVGTNITVLPDCLYVGGGLHLPDGQRQS